MKLLHGVPHWGIENTGCFPDASHVDVQQSRGIEEVVGLQRELGWSQEALEAGCRDQGLSPAAAGMLDGGPAELVQVSFHTIAS